MREENIMYPTSDNDNDTNFSTVVPVQPNNYGARKLPRHDDNIDDKEKKAAAVEEDLQVGMHGITKTMTPIKEIKSTRKAKELLHPVLQKLEHISG